jgi:Cu-Zn family superoxide dismutase
VDTSKVCPLVDSSAPVARASLTFVAILLLALTPTAALAQGGSIGASAEIRDATGRLVASGDFREGRGEVLVTVSFPNPPILSGTHAIHINEIGRCDAPDFATSGSIFNPYSKAHGRQNPEGSEVGDLPNVNFSTGLTAYNTTAIGATLGQGSGSLLSPNRSILIYTGEDDQRTDPDGNPGVPIACGVIEAIGAAPAAAPAVGAASPTPAIISRVAASPVPAAAQQPGQPAQPAAQPASSPIVVPKPVVVVNNNPPSPTPVVAGALPTALGGVATPVPLAAAQSSQGLSTFNALIIAVLGAGLIVVGWLLRQRRQQQR